LRRALSLRAAEGKHSFKLVLTSATMNEALFAAYLARRTWDPSSPDDAAWAPVLKVGGRIYAAHVKNFTIRSGFPLRAMQPAWGKRAMQFTDLPTGDLNMSRYVELLLHVGYQDRYTKLMGTTTAPLVVAEAVWQYSNHVLPGLSSHSVPILTVAVPVLTTDSLTWTCSGEAPARHALLTRGLIPLLAEGSARATDTDTTDEILSAAIEHAKESGYCRPVRPIVIAPNARAHPLVQGDAVVALHRIGSASVVKIVSCQ
jgi:hypothetical protein